MTQEAATTTDGGALYVGKITYHPAPECGDEEHEQILADARAASAKWDALSPEDKAAGERGMWLASNGTDAEWFEETGMCGHCGCSPERCDCTADDPCDCSHLHPAPVPVAAGGPQ